MIERMFISRHVIFFGWHFSTYVHYTGRLDFQSANDFVLWLLYHFISFMELPLSHSSLFDCSQLMFFIGVQIEFFGERRKKWVQISSKNDVVFGERIFKVC